MLVYIALFIFGITFVELFYCLNISSDISMMQLIAKDSVKTLTSNQMDDNAKETIIRGQSVKLLKLTAILLIKCAVVIAGLFFLFALLTNLWPEIKQPLINSSTSLADITFITIATTCYIWLRNAVWKKLQSA